VKGREGRGERCEKGASKKNKRSMRRVRVRENSSSNRYHAWQLPECVTSGKRESEGSESERVRE